MFLSRAGRCLRADRAASGAFALGAVLTALAHGTMAACAGLLGEALLRTQLAPAARIVETPILRYSPAFIALFGLCAAVVKLGASALCTYGQHLAAFRFGDAVRADVAVRALCQGRSDAPARSLASLVVQIRDVERGVDEGLLAGMRAAVQLVPLAIVLVVLSRGLALTALLALAPFALALASVRSRFRRGREAAARLAERLHTGVDELFRHLDLWRTFGSGAQVLDGLSRAGDAAGRATAHAEAGRAALSGANEVLAAAALLALIALVDAGRVAVDRGALVAFATVFFMTYRPLRDLGDARARYERGADALAALDPPPGESQDRQAARTSGDSRSGVEPHRRWLAADLEVEGLRTVRSEFAPPSTSFRARHGEVVAIVGPTGVGKTTLLRTMLGLEPATEGRVLYGGRDLTQAGVGPAQRPFAWVPQDAAIVAGSLEENVTMGVSRLDPETASRAARDALAAIGADALAERRRGERLEAGGAELSGGERQWIAIARALASGQPVLLLDEPTSGLDAAAQQRVLATLAALRGHRTLVIVTHRPEPLELADQVIRLESEQLGDRRGAEAQTAP